MSETIEMNVSESVKKKSKSRRVLGVLFDIFTVAVVVFVIFLLIVLFQLRGLTTEGISVAGYRMFLVQTMSMDPVYPAGSIVVAKRMPLAELNVGDVITFHSTYSDAVVTHRIVGVSVDGGVYHFTTKGDNNLNPDSSIVIGSNVIGKVIWGVPKLGLYIGQLRSVWGLVLLVILPSALVIIGESFKLAAVIREEKAKKKASEAADAVVSEDIDLNGDELNGVADVEEKLFDDSSGDAGYAAEEGLEPEGVVEGGDGEEESNLADDESK